MCHITRIIASIHRMPIHDPLANIEQLSMPSAVIFSRNITELSQTFTPGQQADSDEFLNSLLNHLEKCLMLRDLPYDVCRPSTTINNLFGFEVTSTVQCHSCERKSSTVEPYFVLNVPIKGYTTLDDAMSGFFRTEKMSNENAYNCYNCSKYVDASKQFSMTNIPPYLIFCLKRFERFGLTHNQTRKLSHFIEYPGLIDINSYINDDDKKSSNETDPISNTKFHLYGVIIHMGQCTNNGHLFAYVRGPNKCWYKADDSVITLVSLDEVLSSNNAYLLFYAASTSSISSIHSFFPEYKSLLSL